jgi:hypothetical protein
MALSSTLADCVGIVTMLNVACVMIIIGAAVCWVALVGRPARPASQAAG